MSICCPAPACMACTLCRLWELLLRRPGDAEAGAAVEERRCSNAAASTIQAGGAAAEQQAPCLGGQHAMDGGDAAAALSGILDNTSPSAARELLGRKLGEPPRSLETLPSLIPSEINLPEKVRARLFHLSLLNLSSVPLNPSAGEALEGALACDSTVETAATERCLFSTLIAVAQQ